MGAGKSTLGRLLADHLGTAFYDSDALIEEATSQSIATLFTTMGEPKFRELEHQVIATVAAQRSTVLALGGGAIMHGNTQDLLRSTFVVYLEIGATTAIKRIGATADRPLARGGDLQTLLETRIATYRSTASLTLDEQEGESPANTLARLIALLPEFYQAHLA
ncbi:shikimate kinase [Ferrimicrobium sp.]|uniref:shikimate kinase n=1 Tax=Ferrimicrobium sp. TaxID=2926050 RepID=UPI00263A08E5|nr:shikimate kinase [Ferrimicrobium sp.]